MHFTYTSNDVTIDSTSPPTLSGVFSKFLPGTADISIGGAYDFDTGASSDWALFASSEDFGTIGEWKVAPPGGSSDGSTSSGPEPFETGPL